MVDGSISKALVDIFVSELGVERDEITESLAYNSITEWDSVAHMHLIAAIEETFGVEIPDGEVSEMTTFAKAVETVLRLLGHA